jgi:hypothetical protein
MLVRFSSIETGSITMFGDVAVQLIEMLGASGAIPGAIGAKDIPAAVQRLRRQLQLHAASNTKRAATNPNERDEEDREPPVELATRAAPLIAILERAAAADTPVMWEKG